jgi:hypothetical protein
VDNIELDLGEIGWCGMDKDKWRALVNAVINFWVP